MPRKAREISKTGYYHIMMRGNNKEYIFTKDIDKQYFLKVLRQIEDDKPISVIAWCMMDNHAHLIMKAEPNDLYKAISTLNIKFAMKYNNKNDRIGHVFQERYKSQVIEDDAYLLQAIRYIHQNPLKADLVAKISDYKWSSYDIFLYKTWTVGMKSVMKLFDNRIERFVEFHYSYDSCEHLEIKEDIIKDNIKKATRIMEFYAKKDNQEPLVVRLNKEKMLIELCSNTDLSARAIARLSNSSYSSVQRTNKSIKK